VITYALLSTIREHIFSFYEFLLALRNMKLKRMLLRYFPPGIILQYLHNNGELEDKTIDLLNLTLE